ncbi:hypothetical protein PR202_gb22303 [Eleusine coracana subsp. coracana]|uniref:F-box associated beta-propeller type 3 domain-containing protein n=1 Tax=Eleusine coracana subsp. coracana TaxID=191504 RepID=A0AAV5FG86_ELECO|nr:hypothetical protein PR202_gb22303 [Eleusine coracana subsp. coracana]
MVCATDWADDFLCGSCNGLICLYSKTLAIKIANLATDECLNLDKPVKSSRGDHFSFYRFGFHPVTKEYKVVQFLRDHRKYSQGTFSVVQVYTLGSEKWRDIRAPEVLSLSCMKNSGVVVAHGTMYWLTEDTGASWKHAVMAFDLNKETFARIQLPTAALGGSSRQYWITEINGNVCIATAEVNRNLPKLLASELQIWTLDKKVEPWSQNYSIQHAPNFNPGPHFVQRDKIMMQSQSRDRNLCLYDLLGKNCEMKLSNMVQPFDFSPHKPENVQCYICLKSLVRLDAYRKVLHRPRKRVGWELKKWEVWKNEFRKVEGLWSSIYHLEQNLLESLQCLEASHMKAKEILQQLPDEVFRQRVGMKINQILQNLPDFPHQGRAVICQYWIMTVMDNEFGRAKIPEAGGDCRDYLIVRVNCRRLHPQSSRLSSPPRAIPSLVGLLWPGRQPPVVCAGEQSSRASAPWSRGFPPPPPSRAAALSSTRATPATAQVPVPEAWWSSLHLFPSLPAVFVLGRIPVVAVVSVASPPWSSCAHAAV